MTKDVLKPQLWTPRPVAETIAIYADWAATYDAEVTARGYRTPDRIAKALSDHADRTSPVLDFGCGTGLSGIALRAAGFDTLDGTDITAEMLDQAANLGVYRNTWLSSPDDLGFQPGGYDIITAIGVISLGAAPANLLKTLLAHLTTGGILALSFNDPTLEYSSYDKVLEGEVNANRATVLFREHGPHLDDVGMGSDVILLRRT